MLGAVLAAARDLHTLSLGQCPLRDSGLQHLARVLQAHTRLSRVSLRGGGGYSPQGLAAFLAHLARCGGMQHLELGECALQEAEGGPGGDVSERLLQALAGSAQWDFLGLWRCRLGHTAFPERLLTLRTQLRGLTTLVLQDNDLNDGQLGHLARAVRQGVFRYLSHLNLRQNGVGGPGADHLAEAIPRLPRLKELLLRHSAIPAPAALALSLAALRLPALRLLELSDSCAMAHSDVSAVVAEIERVVRAGDVAVGEGVGYAGDDDLMEREFADDRLRLLGPLHTTGKLAGATSSGPAKRGAEEKEEEEEEKEAEAEEEDEEWCEIPYELILLHPKKPSGKDDRAGSVGEELPKAEKRLSSGVGEVGLPRRQLAERQGDDVIIDEVLRISLGHN